MAARSKRPARSLRWSSSAGGESTWNSARAFPRASVAQSSESEVMRNRHCPDPTSSRLPHGPMRSRAAAAGASMSTSTSYLDVTLSILDLTNAAASSAGGRRGMAWTPVIFGSASRSRRKVRQSNRVRSHATRYQRLPSKTNRCGSTSRVLAAPAWSTYANSRRSPSRQAWATETSTSASTLVADCCQGAGTVMAARASMRRRSADGMTLITLLSARSDESSMPVTVPAWMAECIPTPIATASSLSSRRGEARPRLRVGSRRPRPGVHQPGNQGL